MRYYHTLACKEHGKRNSDPGILGSCFDLITGIDLRRENRMKKNMFVVVIMLVLLLSPIDLIPDITPLIGHADDLIYLIVLVSQLIGTGRNRTKRIEG